MDAAVVIALDVATTELLLSDRAAPRHSPEPRPRRDPWLASRPAVRALCARVAACLRDTGFVLLKPAPEVDTARHAMADVHWSFFTCLADPLPHSAAGELLYQVAVAPAPPPHRYYSQSAVGGDIHTDGTYIHDPPPRYVGLVCVQPAQEGGDSIIVDGRRVYAALHAASPWALEWLEREVLFDCDGQRGREATVRRRILERVDGSVRVQYLRSYVTSGHRHAGVPLAPRMLASLDALDAVLQRDELRYVHKLHAGEMMLLDNHRMLHGRTAFVDDQNPERRRRLIRLWGRPHDAPLSPGTVRDDHPI